MLKNRIIIFLLAFFSAAQGTAQSIEPAHYRAENQTRYEAYSSINPELDYETVIAYVNSDVDKDFYSDIKTIEEPDSLLVLCNKNNAFPADYVPEDLVAVEGSYMLREEAAEQFKLMKAAASKEGLKLVIYSAYRSYSRQKTLYESKVTRSGRTSADRYSARAGHSEHQTGLAVDILQKHGYSILGDAGFQRTQEFAWLTENAHKYGYMLRYPEGCMDITGYIYEPWHWRYVGIEAAKEYHDAEYTVFEEYYGRLVQ